MLARPVEEPPSDPDLATLAAAPPWLFAVVGQTGGWLAHQRPPTVVSHMLLLAPAKRTHMRAMHYFHPKATFSLPDKVRATFYLVIWNCWLISILACLRQT